MKRLLIYKILIITLLIGSASKLFAQKSSTKKEGYSKWFVGVNGGVNVFWGDIKFNSFWPSTKMNELQAGGGFVFGRTINSTLKISTSLDFTALNGQKINVSDTLGFKTQALSFAIKGQFNPIALLSKREGKLAFYIESGAGITGWRNLTQNYSTKDTLSNLGWTNPNKEFGFYIPAGIKIEYQIAQNISTYFSSSYNFVFSDLLDGAITGNNDAYSFTALGINYHFGKQKIAPKLLPYSFFEMPYDSIAEQTKKEKKAQKEERKEAVNPFSILYKIPEAAPHTGFEIEIDIAKIGIPATGFFRLVLPSGFIPQSAKNENVSFTKLGHQYEYDFILPMNQDSTSIPIPIKLSEIEKGIFPILIEGEIMDQKGNVFPLKVATYTEIVSEDSWYKGLPIKEQQEFDAQKAKENLTETSALPKSEKKITQKEELSQTIPIESKEKEQIDSTTGVYRIQIMASRKTFSDLDTFKTKHKITEEIYISQADGWYRYNLYSTKNFEEANRLCTKVRQENNIAQAFVTYYKNGKREVLPNQQTNRTSSSKSSKISVSKKPTQSHIKQAIKKNNFSDNKLLYRIEIAISYDQAIPLYLLKSKVGKEPITEFEHNESYYYTIGEFENLEVARAFLDFVKTEFKFENATIAQYQQNNRLRLVL